MNGRLLEQADAGGARVWPVLGHASQAVPTPRLRHLDIDSPEIGVRKPLSNAQHFEADYPAARVEIKNDAVADFF